MSTKKSTRRKSKKSAAQEVKIDISVKQEPVNLLPATFEPIKDGGKYMIPKTWMSEKQVMTLVQKTPPQYIFKRKAKGGGMWDYVAGWYVQKVLNFVFGWLWDYEVVSEPTIQDVIQLIEKKIDQVWVTGKLIVKDGHGNSSFKTQTGRADIKFYKDTRKPVDIGNDIKAAHTDALKKCASLFGIASDVYGKAEYAEEGVKTAVTPAPVVSGVPVGKQSDKAPISVPAGADSPAKAKLFALAREYGAVPGKETKVIEASLKMKINWAKCTEANLQKIHTEFLAKTVK